MVDYNKREIFFSLKDYKSNYERLLSEYLSKHEDFDEKQFVDYELDLYDLCSQHVVFDSYYENGKLRYSFNFANCTFLINKLYDNLVTFKEEYDGWDLELAMKYRSSFNKIIELLLDKKEQYSNLKVKKYNSMIEICKTPEVKQLVFEILNNRMSEINVIKYIEENTNAETIDLFLSEFKSCFIFMSNEFMFHVKDEDIKEALELNKHNLNYVFAYESDLQKFKVFTKDFDGIKTVYNVSSLFNEEKEYTVKLVYLNNMMIDYHDGGFFAHEIEGFENLSHYKYIYENIKERYCKPSKVEEVNKVIIENQEEYIDNDIDNINDYTKSTIIEYLEDIQDYLDVTNYGILVDALYKYFTTNEFPVLEKKIIFKRVNKKKVGWALKEVYKNIKTDALDIEYFSFAKDNINIFEKEVIVTENFLKSNFYKMFTQNPDK